MSEQTPEKQYPMPVSCNDLTLRDQRALIFHLLYSADSFDYEVSLEAIAENISREYGYIILPQDFVFTAASAVVSNRTELDQAILPFLANWRFERLGVITKLILRYAFWEFLHTETPPFVIINEAVELTKCFAEINAFRFVNGVLDEWVTKNRPEARRPDVMEATDAPEAPESDDTSK
ncbi:MAG: N utilization substance protein B-like protein [candidate division TM6 bacterium GW2011_GWE2_42_60]|nr:MAG: N utilization substance protein B-like protein [candidate division TM6 bacterium GW2011_GWE2_42_60]HBY05836.1 transcription antitermination factor NusB [Candidatus Dependentiae bacterium]